MGLSVILGVSLHFRTLRILLSRGHGGDGPWFTYGVFLHGAAGPDLKRFNPSMNILLGQVGSRGALRICSRPVTRGLVFLIT